MLFIDSTIITQPTMTTTTMTMTHNCEYCRMEVKTDGDESYYDAYYGEWFCCEKCFDEEAKTQRCRDCGYKTGDCVCEEEEQPHDSLAELLAHKDPHIDELNEAIDASGNCFS